MTVAGVPARVVGPAGTAEPGRSMEQGLGPVISQGGMPDDYAML